MAATVNVPKEAIAWSIVSNVAALANVDLAVLVDPRVNVLDPNKVITNSLYLQLAEFSHEINHHSFQRFILFFH